MSIKNVLRLAVVVAVATAALPSVAQETKGKFRTSLHVDYLTIADQIYSNANNTLILDVGGTGLVGYTDPRDDRAEEKAATIGDGGAYGLTVDYGLAGWKWGELQIEGNFTHFESEVDNLEVSYRVQGVYPIGTSLVDFSYPTCSGGSCPYLTFPTNVGTVSWDQPQLGAKIRFRPTKQFAPYVGLGVGYYLVDFKRSAEIDLLSRNLAVSSGNYIVYSPKTFEQKTVSRLNGFGPIEVTADNAFEYHLQAGVEYTLAAMKRRWTLFLEGRYFFTDGKVRITTDGVEEFGMSFPEDARGLPQDFIDTLDVGGFPVAMNIGGLMDISSVYPDPKNSSRAKRGPPDGVLDPGYGFIQGGTIKYGGYDFSFGVRFTF